ncbi:hypothetical protein GUJ93_ZPchr0015g6799 [Zizania palustris]|uniref:Secreted protein n=1 Tax=Zizania palustris TaxID=103762 RepID=A0A8J5T943_ZIZPA|nr:hypothetical protein GUJ93_ZPchr0015g6799 [Zizania palustris]
MLSAKNTEFQICLCSLIFLLPLLILSLGTPCREKQYHTARFIHHPSCSTASSLSTAMDTACRIITERRHGYCTQNSSQHHQTSTAVVLVGRRLCSGFRKLLF